MPSKGSCKASSPSPRAGGGCTVWWGHRLSPAASEQSGVFHFPPLWLNELPLN